MIRKDKLPNPWGDDWHLDTQPTVLDIPQGYHITQQSSLWYTVRSKQAYFLLLWLEVWSRWW